MGCFTTKWYLFSPPGGVWKCLGALQHFQCGGHYQHSTNGSQTRDSPVQNANSTQRETLNYRLVHKENLSR